MFKDKNILVTGGAGFIGANLMQRLVSEGARVRVTLHTKGPAIQDDRVEYVYCDLLDPEDCRRVCKDMEYVFFCAAVTSGAAIIEKTPLVHLTPNLIMNTRMMESAYAAGAKKVLFISSSTVYPVTDFPVKETDVTNEFFDKYFIAAWMKRFSEIVCEMYATKIKKPMASIVVRPANAYGPYDDFEWETSHVLPALIRRVVERHDPMEIWGDGRDIKDFIYIDDLVEGLLLAMQELEGFDVINIASGNRYCIRDLLDTLLEIDGYANADIRFDTSKPTMIPKRLIDPGKAWRKIGFKAKTPIDEGLKKTIDWYRSTK